MFIHTLEVRCKLSNEKYYKIQEILKRDQTGWKAEKKGMLYYGLSDKGIIIRTFIINKPDYRAYQIQYIISAQRVLDNGNYVGLFDTKNYKKLEKKINAILMSKSELLPVLKQCKLNRLDFCINVKLDSQEQVKAYINTARRGNIPKGMKQYVVYDKISKREKPTKDDMTVHSKGSFDNVEVSIYNKYVQMIKQEYDKYTDSDYEEAKNIVRIEIRCKKEKIKELKKKYDIDKIKEFMARADKIGNELFCYYLSKMFSAERVRTLKGAKDQINGSEFKPKNKELLIDFVEAANTLRSTAKAIEGYTYHYDKETVKKILYMLKQIDVNYVTATREDMSKFSGDYIPTPLELYKDFVG